MPGGGGVVSCDGDEVVFGGRNGPWLRGISLSVVLGLVRVCGLEAAGQDGTTRLIWLLGVMVFGKQVVRDA